MTPTYDELVEVVKTGIRTHFATDIAAEIVATAAIEALRGAMVPVGWYYTPTDKHPLPYAAFMQPNCADIDERHWTETPLYALPTPEDKPC